MLPEKYVGLILAMSSSVFIGLSFVITKKGLLSSRKRHGKYTFFLKKEIKVTPFFFQNKIIGVSAVEGKHYYLKNWTWWAGIGTSKISFIF